MPDEGELRLQLQGALDREAAVAEVLRSITALEADPYPVFRKVCERAGALCAASATRLWLREGDWFRSAAGWSSQEWTPEQFAATNAYYESRPQDLTSPGAVGRAARSRTAVQIVDVLADPTYDKGFLFVMPRPMRTLVGVPLVRGSEVLGVLSLARFEVEPFTEHEIRLIEAFADQMVIAIQNVRLFNETKEALERQTATSEILSVISGSQTDTRPVFSAILRNATRLCDAERGMAYLYDGEMFQVVAAQGLSREAEAEFFQRPLPPSPVSGIGQMLATRRPVAIADITDDDAYRAGLPQRLRTVRLLGARSVFWVPLLKGGEQVIGALAVYRQEVRPFSQAQIDLVRSFAEQAVIAIENVRLFNETKDALERETASAEVLKIISRSPFELRKVLETVVESATRLCGATHGSLWRLEGEHYRQASRYGATTPEYESYLLARRVRADEAGSVVARVAATGKPVQVEDAQADPAYAEQLDLLRPSGAGRTRLGVPLLRKGVHVGVLVVARAEVKAFTPEEVALVQTFADQAVIAIENARLVGEIEAASRHKSEFLANMSHELRTPLNAVIGFSDVLEQGIAGTLSDKQAEYVKDISSSGKHLLDLVNDILDLSKVEAGRMDLEPSEFSLADTIRAALAFVRERASRHGIELASDLAPDLGTVVADERKVRQIVLNLLSNAVKFTPDGGWIGVSARRQDDEVTVSVKDTGIGIALEDQATVFEEFQQVGKASDRSREGTGLGLTLAKRFIELHGGRIWLESEVGKGTTFTFALPVGKAASVSR